jgi:hypothetical protein
MQIKGTVSILGLFLSVSVLAEGLKSLKESKAFADRASWINENQSEGLNGSFDWFESFEDKEVKPIAQRLLAKCKKDSVTKAVKFVKEMVERVTDQANAEEVKVADQAVDDFRAVLTKGEPQSELEKCSLTYTHKDDVGNRVKERITAFRNKTVKTDIIFLFTEI